MAETGRLEHVRQVTWGVKTHEHPVFSPDGRRIAFYGGMYGWLQIYVTGADGLGERPLTSDKGNHTQPAWSPDGRHVWYRAQEAIDAPWAIWRVAADDPDDRRCFLSDPKWSFKHPSVSPDGRDLLWFSDQGSKDNFHIFRARVKKKRLGDPTRLTNDKNRNDCHPVWSPDGKRIAFHAYMGAVEATTSHIFVADADGKQQRQVTPEAALHKHPFFVGTDLLVHHTHTRKNRRFLALRHVDGRFVTRLTSGRKGDKHPSPFLPKKGPVRIVFASKKRGIVLPPEKNPTSDLFWGHLEGVRVRRPYRVVGARGRA